MGITNVERKAYMKRSLIILVAILSLTGCFHGELITRVQPGMSIEEVKTIMGSQEGYKKIGDYEVYS